MRDKSTGFSPLTILPVSLLLVGLLSGCPSDSDDEDNAVPTADAGVDQTVPLRALITLNGSRSSDPDGDQLAFQWALVSRPAGSTATLSNSTSGTPTLRADITGRYEISLVVNDGAADSEPDTVVVTVDCNGDELLNNTEWVIARQDSFIPEEPFDILIDGNNCGTTKLLTFASRVAGTMQFPQVFVINSSEAV